MARLPIRIFGDPILRERAREVVDFDQGLARLAADMMETMHAASGAGLAGPQVGVLKRLFTWDVSGGNAADDPTGAGTYVNPEVVELSEELQEGEEGCLSFPGLFYPTQRALRVRVSGADVTGEPQQIDAEGLLARVFLHEIDHLNGILFIDHLARHDRKEAMRRIRAGELEHPRVDASVSAAASDHDPDAPVA